MSRFEKWICAPALILGSALVSGTAAIPAWAQAAPTDTAQASVQTYNIAPQALSEALIAFSRQSGLQFSADASVISGLRTSGVSGTMSREQALTALLRGTGLVYRTNGQTVALEKPGAGVSGAIHLDPVQVQGVAPPPTALIGTLPAPFPGGQVARGGQVGILGNKDLMNTPFSTTAYTEKLIRDQQVRTMQDVLANDPTARPASPRFASSSNFLIRGFNVSGADTAFNSMQGLTPFRREMLSNAERVEIQRGPSAMLNNQPLNSAIGGLLNIVPKRATDDPLTRATVNFMGPGVFGGLADVGRRFGDEKAFGIQLNGSLYGGDTPVNNQRIKDLELAAALDWRGDRARATVDVGIKQTNYWAPSVLFTAAATTAIPVAPFSSTNNAQSWSYVNNYYSFGVARGEVDILPNLTAFAAYGLSRTQETARVTLPTITTVTGNSTATVDSTNMNLFTNETAEAGLRGKFDTGPVSHTFVAGASGLWRVTYANPRGTVRPPIISNIFNPVGVPDPNSNIFGGGFQNPASTVDFSSVGAAETMSVFNDRIQFIAGGRLQRIALKNFSTTTGLLTSAYEATAFSPSVALLAKPIPELSIYGSWIQGLQRGPQAPNTAANAGQVFPPMVTQQYEAGAKLEVGKFGATLALFQITQPQSFTSPFSNVFAVDGLQQNSGIEFTTFGEPLEGVRLLGGFTLMKGIQTQTAGGAFDGRQAVGTPNFLLNIGGEWDLPWVRGLTLTSRFIYTSMQYVDQANTQSIPYWGRVDAGVRYTMDIDNKPLTFRLNVDNVFNNNYWQSAGNGLLTQSQPLTLMLSISRDF